MKRFNLLSVVIAVILMVGAVSCTTLQGTDDGYYDRYPQASNRIYVDDPYRGTVVLERDPYSGRYYETGTIGSYYPGYTYRGQTYGSGYGRTYRNRNYNNNKNYNRNNTYNNGNQGQTEQQRKEWQQQKKEARKKVLGN
jgi:hypothetical protein